MAPGVAVATRGAMDGMRHAACWTPGVDRFAGLLLGTAVGDSLGLPREGLSRSRASRMYPGELRQRLVLGRGMLSDDTEHACMTLQALLRDDGDPERFARALAWKLRWWLLALPPAIGSGTLRALIRLWLGWSPARSGVHSAGNGAVMRAPVIGAWFDDLDRMAQFVAASTAISEGDDEAVADFDDGGAILAGSAHRRAGDDVRERSGHGEP